MPYYHGTFLRHIDSILKNGLRPTGVEQNWDGCDEGVYLTENVHACAFVMVDHYMQFGKEDSIPEEHIGSFRFIVIDDSRIDKRKLRTDPLINRSDVHRYLGIIDVTGMPILTIDDFVDTRELRAMIRK
jgi:hypothetical protein